MTVYMYSYFLRYPKILTLVRGARYYHPLSFKIVPVDYFSLSPPLRQLSHQKAESTMQCITTIRLTICFTKLFRGGADKQCPFSLLTPTHQQFLIWQDTFRGSTSQQIFSTQVLLFNFCFSILGGGETRSMYVQS